MGRRRYQRVLRLPRTHRASCVLPGLASHEILFISKYDFLPVNIDAGTGLAEIPNERALALEAFLHGQARDGEPYHARAKVNAALFPPRCIRANSSVGVSSVPISTGSGYLG